MRREVSAEGRSRAWVNGSPTTASVLGQLGALLVDLHGQHETQSLLHADAQRDILDAFAHAEAERAAVAEAHAALVGASRARRRRSRAGATRCAAGPTTCATSCSEIEQARLKPGEDEALQVEARRLSQAGALGEQAQRIVDALEGDAGNALGALGAADRALAGLEKVDPAVAGWREMLDAAYTNLSELARQAVGLRRRARGGSRAAGRGRAAARPAVQAHRESTARRSRPCSPRATAAPPSWICSTPPTSTSARSAPAAPPPSRRSARRRTRSRPSAPGRRRPARPRRQPAAAAARAAGRQAARLARAARRAGGARAGDACTSTCSSTSGSRPSRSRGWRRAASSRG